jgi:ATP-dependent DNA helicase RecQ
MLFSTVARTGQRFGAGHVIDVLRGANTEKIAARGHDELPTFGAGVGRPKGFWQAFVRQAVAAGCLAIDIERMGGLRLTPKGEAVLQGEARFEFREIPERAQRERKPRKRAAEAEASLSAEEAALLKSLKELRLELAKDRGVPAYVIFPDAALHEMCRERPQDLAAFGRINGVGPKKLSEFGETFLAEIRRAA